MYVCIRTLTTNNLHMQLDTTCTYQSIRTLSGYVPLMTLSFTCIINYLHSYIYVAWQAKL